MSEIKKTAIIILTYNNLIYNKNCIDSIRKHTKKGTYQIIVVDNNSTDGTKEWLTEQTDLTLILNDYNAGFPKGCNMGIDAAPKSMDILLLNNDTVVTPRWLENLQSCLYSKGKIGAAGAVCNKNENLQGVDFTYNSLDEMESFADKNNISDSSRWEEKIFLIGFCILIKREVVDRIGKLDEMYSPGYVEDNDLCLSIIDMGYKLMLCHDCFIHHYLGSAFRDNLSKFYPILYANREKFKDKWGFQTYLFDDIRFNLLKIMNELDKNKHMNILEIGCGLGVSLLKIKKDYPNAKLFGIEEDPNIARVTKNIVSLSTKSVREFPLEFPYQYFDYIFIGNYLEKVDNTEEFLKGIRLHLKKDGYIISAVQNIMHYSVIEELLKGDWHYAKQHVLRRSNSIFLTANDIIKLFTEYGYTSPYIFHWYSVLTENEKSFVNRLNEISGGDKEHLFRTYEYAVKFQKNV